MPVGGGGMVGAPSLRADQLPACQHQPFTPQLIPLICKLNYDYINIIFPRHPFATATRNIPVRKINYWKYYTAMHSQSFERFVARY